MMFYSSPRFVHHIDDNAVMSLTEYYTSQLPDIGSSSASSKKPTILDICSSWTSHVPANTSATYNIHGMGMSRPELAKNPELKSYVVKDMNDDPEIEISADLTPISMTMCTVSIDYLNKPLEVLASIARKTEPGGKIHLAISNRCFPTKVVKWWTYASEEERLEGVCRYLYFAGSDVAKEKRGKGGGLWEKIEIVEVVGESEDPGGNDQGFKGWLSQFRRNDPLWVVRATRTST